MKIRLSKQRSGSIVESFERLHIGVLGDVMLDRYIRGSARRLSPEAPVPVVEIEEESEHPGGAANVAVNLRSLGVEVSIIGMVGEDANGHRLVEVLSEEEIDARGLVSSPSLKTTVKTRVIADGQHIVRADRESSADSSQDVVDSMIKHLRELLPSLDALVLQDYDKGTLSSAMIKRTIEIAREEGVPLFVDPKHDNFFEYQSVSFFKPNRVELERAIGEPVRSIEKAVASAAAMRTRINAEHLVLTLGRDGMILVSEGVDPYHVETRAIQVADVSGAGDTVIALLAAAGAAGATPLESVILANAGAGIVCGRVGTVSVTAGELTRILGDLEEEAPMVLTYTEDN